MFSEIGAGYASLKAAKDIIQGINALNTSATVNEVKVALQGHILDAQQSLFAAQEKHAAAADRIQHLEQEIMRMKAWKQEAQKYELINLEGGSCVYMLKLDMRECQPPHWLCAHCFDNGQKGILQPQPGKKDTPDKAIYGCPACKNALTTHWRTTPEYAVD